MAVKYYNETDIQNIANAIRSKNGSTDGYKVSQMAEAILNITQGSGGIIPTGSIKITENGTYDVTNYASAIVDFIGGSSSDLPSNAKIGVLELEENSPTAITITHGFEVSPKIITCFPLGYIDKKGTIGGFFMEGATCGLTSDASGGKTYSTSVVAIANVNETTFDFAPRSIHYPLIGGTNYFWVAITF